ncbi:hypothetical protein KKG82_01970, partial [Patescibacteria group bacterium]|nr:hypothetical protein [Patescibacteria group bacterium]
LSFVILLPQGASAIFVPNVPTIPIVDTSILDTGLNYECETEIMLETYPNGRNKAYIGLSYMVEEDVANVHFSLKAVIGDNNLLLSDGTTTLKPFLGNNFFEDNLTKRKLVNLSGLEVHENLFYLYEGKEVVVTATMNGKTCTSKKVTAIDELTCHIDGEVTLLDDGTNKVYYATLMNVDADRDGVPYGLTIHADDNSLLAEKGMTNLVATGNLFVTKDGLANRYVIVDPTVYDTVSVGAVLGGHTCTGKEFELISRNSLIDSILHAGDSTADRLVPVDPTFPRPELFGEDLVLEGDSVPVPEEGVVDSGDADSRPTLPLVDGGEVVEDGEVMDGDVAVSSEESVVREEIPAEVIEEILAEAEASGVDITDEAAVTALVEAYLARSHEEKVVNNEAVGLVTNVDNIREDTSFKTMLYVLYGFAGVIVVLLVGLLIKYHKKDE